MPGYEYLTVFLRLYRKDACLVRACDYLKVRHSFYIFPAAGSVSRMRYVEFIVKTPEQHSSVVVKVMEEHARKLLRKRILLDAVVIVEPRLSAPADVERRVYVRFGPLHYLT